jgi:uracil-DNA glycosylase
LGQLQDNLRLECQKRGLKYIDYRGDKGSRILFLGEAPGADEDQQGYPFVGASGQELDREIEEAGLSESDCWFTNPYKTRPPENKLPRLNELGIDPKIHEVAFWEQISETKPIFIATLGQTATNLLCPETFVKRKEKDDEGISFSHWRGSLLTSPYLNWPHYVIPLYHPAFILREYSERDTNVFVLRKLQEEFSYWQTNAILQPLPCRSLEVQPNITQYLDFLRGLLDKPKPCGVDIEMLRRRIPYTIAIADSPNHAVSICFWDYSNPDLIRLFRYLGAFLQKVPQIGQNYTTFDANWLRVLGVPPNIELVDDTLIKHHVLWPELSHKLEFQVMQYTREPFFKEEGKGWNPRNPEQKNRLMTYNCKDACTTLEIFNEQEKEFDDEPAKRRFYEDYEMPLARRYYNIDQRGLLFDPTKRESVLQYINRELAKNDGEICQTLGKKVYSTSKSVPSGEARDSYYLLSYSKDVIKILEQSGIKPKKKPFSGKETTDEESLNELFAETSSPILKQILRGRELTKFKGTYVLQKLHNNISYTNYNVAGTLGGRRSARKNFLGFGSNHQNQPQHGDLAKEYKKIIVARPGKVFVYCDQMQAEDWIVNGIIADVSGVRTGLDELISGVDRHKRLAAFLFGLPESACGKDTIQRFLGKKVRHAGNYDMRENRMSGALAKEGFDIKPQICAALLEKFHENNPEIRSIFHKWVEVNITKRRRLDTPLGRSRTFFGVHPYRDNSKLFKEAYSYVPQTTVGDNTGLAVLYCENNGPKLVTHECHDSVRLEVEYSFSRVIEALLLLKEAFNRVIRFENGLEIVIPIEYEVGFSFGSQIKCPSPSEAGLKNIWHILEQQASHRILSTSGVPLHV